MISRETLTRNRSSGASFLPPRPVDSMELERLEREADQWGDAALAKECLSPNRNGHSRKPNLNGPGFNGFGAGRPLPPHLQARLTRNFGLDLSEVRVHDDTQARATTEEINANAAVSGNDIALSQPVESVGSESLIAHEVAHMVQSVDQPGMPALLKNGGNGSSGIGARPPRVDFTTGSGTGPEDRHVTFEFDSAQLSPSGRASLRQLARNQSHAVEMDLYGYSSSEGADDYNLNLSAHRAVAVQQFLQPLLPEGSVVRLHAHGEISDFGDPAENRRVGIDVQEQPETTSTPAQLPGLPRPGVRAFPDISFGIGPLTLGAPPTSEEPDPEADTGDSDVPSPDAEPETVPPPNLPLTFRLPLATPLTLPPRSATSVFQFPPLGSADYNINYLPMARSANLRGLHLPDLLDQGELESAYALHRQLYPWIPENPPHIRNWLGNKIVGAVVNAINAQAFTERALDAHLRFEYPGLQEDLERMGQIDRMMRGEDEPFVIPPITIYELQFDITSRGLQFY